MTFVRSREYVHSDTNSSN